MNDILHKTGLPRSVANRLFREGYGFDFFQAVRLLERLAPDRVPVGRDGPLRNEVVRFRALVSLAFPPSAIYEVTPPQDDHPTPIMTVAFLGLHGPSGVLPRHYTELLLQLQREGKGIRRHALREWLDLFNHRLISLFYRAWEKYRFFVPYERGEAYGDEDPDLFTFALYSLVGLGFRPLQRRLRVAVPGTQDGLPTEKPLARIEDLALLHYAGLFAHRPRNAVSLQALVADYFGIPAEVQQFRGQWLALARSEQTQFGKPVRLGVDVVVGDRVWDVQGKFRLRLGPLAREQFNEFLPDRTPSVRRKTIFLLAHLVRLYVGPELDFDVQLILKAADVPPCRLETDGGANLGWNTWLATQPFRQDAEDAAFEAEDVVYL